MASTKREIWYGTAQKDGKTIKAVKSCGVVIFRHHDNNSLICSRIQFLLLKHLSEDRYDLPKGHVEVGETEHQTALRELYEETGIEAKDVELHETFRYEEVYYPKYKRFGNETVEKKLLMFLGKLKDSDKPIALTEHKGFEWKDWNPPHSIQKNTIDPLLKAVQSQACDWIAAKN